MALANSGSISPQCNVIVHHLESHGIEKQRNPIPTRLIQVELTIEFQILGHHNPMTNVYALLFSSQQTLRFNLNVFRDHQLFDQLLAPAFATLGINISLVSYNTVLRQIRVLGLDIFAQSTDDNRRRYCKAFSIHSLIRATLVESEMMTSAALAESASEFERSNYGVVAATQSSIDDMLKRVRVEEDYEENCTICMEQLEVGFEASQMPCSHIFHADCIRKWLNLSHYCPNCRYEMPTD